MISAFVFHRRGKPVYPTVLAKQWTRAARAAGLPGKFFHDLRRTAVRNMIRSGTPETVAMKVSGHKTRAMLDRYNITDGRDMAKALRAPHEYASQKGPESAAVVSIGGRTQRPESTDTLAREA